MGSIDPITARFLDLDAASRSVLPELIAQASHRYLPKPGASQSTLALAAAPPSSPENVIGVGLGHDIVDGKRRPTIKFLVRRKVGLAALDSGAVLPRSLQGVMTRVEQSDPIVAQFTGRFARAGGGASIGNCGSASSGTFACLVADQDANAHVLSNNHVIALSNAAPIGSGVCQPGPLDGGVCPADTIATLAKAIPISFTLPNRVDAAIAKVTAPKRTSRQLIRAVLPTNPNRVATWEALQAPHVAPALGLKVQKSGRTTDHTHGTISLVLASTNVHYGGRIAQFIDQFRVTGNAGPFSQPGDSGSLVTTDPDNQPVGLLFAGNGAYTFCNNIADVLSALSVTIRY